MSVNWSKLIQNDCLMLQQDFHRKEELLASIADTLAARPEMAKCKRDKIFQALLDREKQGSTGLGEGIAVPHCGLDKASGFVVLVITLKQPIEFESFDGQPCDLIISIVGPQAERNHHVQILSALASGLQKKEEIQKLLHAEDPQRALGILRRIFQVNVQAAEDADSPVEESRETQSPAMSRITVVIQREKFFIPLLEKLASVSNGSIFVYDVQNPGVYMQRMPLYAYVFGGQKSNLFQRVIEAVVPQTEMTKIKQMIRRIVRKVDRERGVLVFEQELKSVIGSLDY